MNFLTAGFWPSLWATLLLGVCLFACLQPGAFVLRLLGLANGELSKEEFKLFSIATGLLIFSLAILLIGHCGFLARPNIWILLTLFSSFYFFQKESLFLWKRPKKWVFFAIFALGLSWLGAVTPPIGTDALSYHLTHPRIFIENHRIFYIPNSRESLWPYFTEMLFTAGLSLQGTTLATLFHWVFFALTAWAVSLFGRRFFSENIGKWSGLIFLFTPAAFAQSTHAYVDLAAGFYVFMSLFVFALCEQAIKGRHAFLLGLMTGGALAVKYLSLGAAALWFLILAVRSKLNLKTQSVYLLGAFVAAGVWYVRSWIILGNPLYPFFPKIFAGRGVESDIGLAGTGTGFLSFLVLPWNMTLFPNFFGGDIMGPLFLISLPFLIFKIKKARPIFLYLTAFAVLLTGFLFTQSQNTRFFLVVIPILAVGAAVVFEDLKGRGIFLKRVVLALMGIVMILHAGIYVYRARSAWQVWIGQTSAENYLSDFERSFKAYRYLEGAVKPGEKVFNAADARYFYSTLKNMTIDNRLWRLSIEPQGGVSSHLAAEKYDYVWLSADSNQDVVDYVRQNNYREVYAYEFTEKPKTFRYQIFKKP